MSRGWKFLYAAVMLFALFIVVGGKCPSIGRAFMAPEPPGQLGGDLYRLSELDRFREEITLGRQAPMGTLEEADVLTLGDSFFNSNLGSDLFASELAGRLGRKVYNLRSDTFFEPQSYPLSFLESIGYQPGKKRVLILESVERSVLDRGDTYNAASGSSGNKIDAIAFKVLKNSDVEYFFKNNVIVHPVEKWLKNVRFDYFRIVDKSVGSFSENPDMLFYQRDIDFGKTRKSDALLDQTADSIERLSKTLQKRYNVELIYVVIPNKYSVYHHLVQDGYRYDDFIPRLSRKLTARGVKNIDLYSLYCRYNKPGMPLLYYASDTHYTPLGKRLLVDACAAAIEKVEKERL